VNYLLIAGLLGINSKYFRTYSTSFASEHISGATSEPEKASKEMPEIAHSRNEIASTTSRYRLRILLSQIFSAVARAFF
jgi:hypothetical protein